jgi:hypothetical protein
MRKKALAKAKRPTDVNQLAHFLGEQSTTQRESSGIEPSESEVSRVMAALGRKGGKIGGNARAASMTSSRRREIALNAARKRWEKKPKNGGIVNKAQ